MKLSSKGIVRSLLSFAAIASLGACASMTDVNDVKAVQTVKAEGGTAFTQAATDEYRVYSDFEAKQEGEWDHAAVFARKGLMAAKGIAPEPEVVASWTKVPAARVPELNDARARLVGYFAQGARERVPADAAKAQLKFDCWIEEEAENDSTSECRSSFLEIEPRLKPPVVQAAAVKTKVVKTFVIYFGLNKSNLDADAMKVLAEVVKAQAEIAPSDIYVSGNTDTVGSATANQTLSDKRARTVALALQHRGVAAALDMTAYGENNLAVQTADNVNEHRNRRVEIRFEK